jgi:hypothetical protein
MGAAWIDKPDNTGMASATPEQRRVPGSDHHDFADMTIRAAPTSNFEDFAPPGAWPEFGALAQ